MHLTVDRKGNIVEADTLQDKLLGILYGHMPGRLLLRPMTSRRVSMLGGAFLDSRFSRMLIPWFIRSHSIDMGQYESKEYVSYNDFFTRKLRKGARKVEQTPGALVSPCDSRVSVYQIDGECSFSM